ncbi:MAG TPA: nucleoside deaminase [Gemmatimonadaceae bacterium]|nr:nucleoside deaminase [Gemmatimonadaceae bacterium]
MTGHAVDDERHMRRCLELARRALDAGDVPVGALIVREERIIGEGYERVRAELDPSAHAEIVAIREACRATGSIDLSGATLYTTVEPCVLCAYAVRQGRIARLVFGVPAGELGGATGTYPVLGNATVAKWGAPPTVQGGVCAAECAALLARRRR